jgi:LacI family transcriptional regulator
MPENNQSRTIGVILPKLDSHFISSAISGIENITGGSGYELILTNSQENLEKEASNAELLFESGVDGIIASLAMPMQSPGHFARFAGEGVPMVFFDRVPETGFSDRITIDNAACGYMATEHLIGQGCRRIAFITFDLVRSVYAQRYNGYRKALEKAGLELPGDPLILADEIEQACTIVAEWIRGQQQKPDGVFVADDLAAAMCLQAFAEAGISVPEDIAIVGFNNDPVGRLVTPTLTTIRYPGYEMGSAAAACLLGRLEGHRRQPGNITVLSSELIVRNSSVRLRPALS